MDNLIDVLSQYQLEIFEQLAYEAYHNMNYEDAVSWFGKALEISQALNLSAMTASEKFWRATCNRHLFKYKIALAELLEVVSSHYVGAYTTEIYYAYTDIIHISIKLPVSLSAIENYIQKADLYADKTGKPAWRSITLYYKAEILWRRNFRTEALEIALEALALRVPAVPCYIIDSHYNLLVWMMIDMGDISRAKQYFQKWDMASNEYPVWRKKYKFERNIQLARATNNKEEALRLARELIHITGVVTDYSVLIECYIINGLVDHAYDYLLTYIKKMRTNESMFAQEFCFRLLGDYHLAKARQIAKYPLIDLDYPSPDLVESKLKRKIKNKDFKKHLGSAARCYKNAFDLALEIDNRLVCNTHATKISERLKQVHVLIR